MANQVDTVIHNATILLSLLEKYQAEFTERGSGPERTAVFKALLEDASGKDTAQRTAEAVVQQHTQSQDYIMHEAAAFISIVQAAAKAAFWTDMAKLKEFRVGVRKPRSVKEMLSVLDYFSTTARKYEDVLLKNGITQDDVAKAKALYTELSAIETQQENAKKLRNAATQTRNEVVSKLHDENFRIKKFAQARFSGDKARLEEFASVTRYRRKEDEAGSVPAPAVAEQAAPSFQAESK